jgi:hypothetical protein
VGIPLVTARFQIFDGCRLNAFKRPDSPPESESGSHFRRSIPFLADTRNVALEDYHSRDTARWSDLQDERDRQRGCLRLHSERALRVCSTCLSKLRCSRLTLVRSAVRAEASVLILRGR